MRSAAIKKLGLIIVLAAVSCDVSAGFISFYFSQRTISLLHSSGDEYDEGTTRRRVGRVRPARSRAVNNQVEARRLESESRYEEALKDPTLLSNVMFAERSDIHPATKRALVESMGLKAMTDVQVKTYAAALSGKNVLGRARTGTGKTLAFLVPIVERLLQGDRRVYLPGLNIGAIILAPTRELAIQIADEAKVLLSLHDDLSALCVYGGTKIQGDTSQISKRIPSILVATPGRLLEHMEQTRIRGRRFSDIVKETKIVVLDETDRLLGMGFDKDINRILSFLPRSEKRQTLLFSATIPKKVRFAVDSIMGSNYVDVDCIGGGGENSLNQATNIRVQQTFVLLDNMEAYLSTLVNMLVAAMKEDENYKVIVFFPAAKIVQFFADYFETGLGLPVLKLHSRMTQSARLRTSSEFRTKRRSILFTSDVSARGVDYPDVTLVIQYGSADTGDTYIHRLGRTGRQGKSGKGMTVLLPLEKKIVPSLKRRGITEDSLLSKDFSSDPKPYAEGMQAANRRIRSGDAKLTSAAEGAYRAFLAYYISRMNDLDLSAQDVVVSANHFAKATGLLNIPTISSRVASALDVAHVEGIKIDESQ